MTEAQEGTPTAPAQLRAELSLRLVLVAQGDREPRGGFGKLALVPDLISLPWEDARELLAAAPKPMIVAPLVEPGTIANWSIAKFPPASLPKIEHEFANTQNYFREKLRAPGLDRIERIIHDSSRGELELPVTELHCWLQEYMVTVGITIFPTLDPTVGQLIVMRPGGGGPARTPRPEPPRQHTHDSGCDHP